jgi:hypothetical protein
MRRKIGVAGVFLSFALLTSCWQGQYYAGVAVGPPAPIVEGPYGAAPGPDYLWTPGFYDWSGGAWAWQRGQWRHRPHPVDHWVAPHYARHGNGYRRTGGGWQHGNHGHHMHH